MALSKLTQLYMAVITDHASNPHYHGTLVGVEPLTLHNPTCGDVIHLFVKLVDGSLEDIRFSGQGCSISTASASMMTNLVKGKNREEVESLLALFSQMMQGKEIEESTVLGDAAILAGVAKFPQRIKCANLAWQALSQVLAQQ